MSLGQKAFRGGVSVGQELSSAGSGAVSNVRRVRQKAVSNKGQSRQEVWRDNRLYLPGSD